MNKCKNVYLLGAGFSKAIDNQIPLNNDLTQELISKGCSNIKKYADKYQTKDIEKLLTCFDIDANINAQKKEQERLAINEEISSFFQSFRFSKWFSKKGKINYWIKAFTLDVIGINDAIICLNYDCLFEGILDYLDVWSPNGGYARIKNPLSERFRKNLYKISIYKIHGSENFVVSKIRNSFDQTGISYQINESIYPKTASDCNIGGGYDPNPYIIAPSFVKIPHVDISAMMIDLLKVVKDAKTFVVIGCGLRSEDSYLWLLLTVFLNRKNKDLSLIIVDPQANNIYVRIRKYWVGCLEEHVKVILIPDKIEKGVNELKSIISQHKW